jgi:uncharacterized protein YbaR (Trm112 family)
MLRCPAAHPENVLVLSTGELMGRMVRSGILGCPVCHREYPIVHGVARFSSGANRHGRANGATAASVPEAETLQALLDLSGPGGYVVLVGCAARQAVGLAALMGGIHFVGVNAPREVEELPVLSLLLCAELIPLRPAMARGVVVGADAAGAPWLAEAQRVLLRGRRLVIEQETVAPSEGVTRLAVGQGVWVGEKR